MAYLLHPKLLAHLEGVKILMRESESWEEFMAKLEKHYPIFETTELGFTVQLKKRERKALEQGRIIEITSQLS